MFEFRVTNLKRGREAQLARSNARGFRVRDSFGVSRATFFRQLPAEIVLLL